MSTDAVTREHFLKKEMPMITHFLSSFRFKDDRIKPSISVGPDWKFIIIKNFPLSDEYNIDHEDILIVLIDYPDIGPAGVHIREKSTNSRMIRDKIGHVYSYDLPGRLSSEHARYVEELPGWNWICFHYEDWHWNFNPRNVLGGDNLDKYIQALYVHLCGAFKG